LFIVPDGLGEIPAPQVVRDERIIQGMHQDTGTS
jgi:hypothetical protein